VYFCLRNNVEMKPLINKTCTSLGQVALVQDKAATTEATGTAHLLHPLCPLWIQLTVRLFVLRLEHTDCFLNKQTHPQCNSPHTAINMHSVNVSIYNINLSDAVTLHGAYDRGRASPVGLQDYVICCSWW